MPPNLIKIIDGLGKRSNDKQAFEEAIVALCKWKALKVSELASILNRNPNHILYTYVSPLREAGKLQYLYPDMPNHPEQAYRATT